jgi:hypothetical protein
MDTTQNGRKVLVISFSLKSAIISYSWINLMKIIRNADPENQNS